MPPPHHHHHHHHHTTDVCRSTPHLPLFTPTPPQLVPFQEDKYLEQQKQEYARRGISLAHFASGTDLPYFCNLDEDSYRSKRYLYVLQQEVTVFGQKGDIQV